jgi:hypothetical protein
MTRLPLLVSRRPPIRPMAGPRLASFAPVGAPAHAPTSVPSPQHSRRLSPAPPRAATTACHKRSYPPPITSVGPCARVHRLSLSDAYRVMYASECKVPFYRNCGVLRRLQDIVSGIALLREVCVWTDATASVARV